MMTFEEFQATRRHVDCVATATEADLGPDRFSGYLYASDLHIFDGREGADAACLLVIGSTQRVSDDLSDLEGHLYDYGIRECTFD